MSALSDVRIDPVRSEIVTHRQVGSARLVVSRIGHVGRESD